MSIRIRLAIAVTTVLGLALSVDASARNGLTPLDDTAFDQVYVAPRADFSDYDSVVLSDVGIWYPAGSERVAETDALRSQFAARFATALRKSGLDIVSASGPRTLRLSVQLIDLKHHEQPADLGAWQRRLAFGVAPGRLTLVARLEDSVSGETVMQFADLEPAAGADETVAFDAWGRGVAVTLARLGVAPAAALPAMAAR